MKTATTGFSAVRTILLYQLKKIRNLPLNSANHWGGSSGFRAVSRLTPQAHDEMIAYLSQLTHCIAVTLMCCHDNKNLEEYTGDSFRDLTRIAKINDAMWSELFLLNKSALLEQMDLFMAKFQELRNDLETENLEDMRAMMRLSTERRKRFDQA